MQAGINQKLAHQFMLKQQFKYVEAELNAQGMDEQFDPNFAAHAVQHHLNQRQMANAPMQGGAVYHNPRNPNAQNINNVGGQQVVVFGTSGQKEQPHRMIQ